MSANADDLLGPIFDFVGDPIFVKDRTHRLCLVNDACCKALGQPREKLIGLTDFDLFGRMEAEFFRSRDEKVFLTGEEDVIEETFTPVGSAESRTVITRKQIIAQVWGDSCSRRTIDTHVSSLRGKLGGSEWILTVRGVGFRLGHG